MANVRVRNISRMLVKVPASDTEEVSVLPGQIVDSVADSDSLRRMETRGLVRILPVEEEE